MSASFDPLSWLNRAEEDYILARYALRRRKPLIYGACFHAQQCAEKYLKAILISRGQAFPKTHDLLALNDLCEQAGVMLPIDVDHLDLLSSYAVQIRYPGAELTPEEARRAYGIAQSVRRFVRGFLGVK